MNHFNNYRVLVKLCRIIKRRSVTTCSVLRWKDGPLPESGLQTRFLNFLEQSNETNENDESQIQELCMPTSLRSVTSVQNNYSSETFVKDDATYKALIESVQTQLLTTQGSASKNELDSIDKQCCRVLGSSSQSQMFYLLNLLTKAVPNEITSMKFYKNVLLTLRKMLELGRLKRQEILELLFFESWNQKNASGNVKYIMSFLSPLEELSLMELTIVAQSAYQCSIALKVDDVRLLQNTIEANAPILVKDTPILTALCKAIRRAGPTHDCLLENLSKAIVDRNKRFVLINAPHILSLYAEAGIENSDVLQRLFDDSMMFISMDNNKKFTARIKDLDRLLWASSMMNYELRNSDCNTIGLFLDRRYEELEKEPFYLANIILSLWILNYRPRRIIQRCFANGVLRPIVAEPKFWKRKARLHLLLSCIKIEAPEIEVPEELSKPYEVGLKVSRSVKRLREIINRRLTETMDIEEIAIDCPVEGLYIPGVSFKYKNNIIHVDLLDETNCFKGALTARGFMKLKLRLLPKIGVHSIPISEIQLNDLDSLSSTLDRCILNVVK